MTEITENDAFRKVAAYCAAAEHCRAEIVEKMQRWGLPYEVVNRVADRLEQEKYIDEERFCRAFVRDKYRLTKWGKVKIGQALQLKKIPRLVYLPLLNEIDEADYLSVLQGLLASKKKSVHAASEFELNAKLIRFALSRGFELKDIRRCIDIPDEELCEAD